MLEAIEDYAQIAPIKITPGAEVTGAEFFGREDELLYLKERLSDRTSSVIIPGPRRWGKSSFIKEFIRQNSDNFNFLYMHLHRCQSIEMFYDYFLDSIELKDPGAFRLKSGRAVRKATNTLTGVIRKIGFQGVEVEAGKVPTNTHRELFRSMEQVFSHFSENRIILVLDEISDFMLDVRSGDGKSTVNQFLKWLRNLRQAHKVQMVLTGSINILWTLKEFQAEDLVGDIRTVPLNPLSLHDSVLFLRSLLKSKDIRLSGDALNFCTDKFQHGVHYFIQILADEIASHTQAASVIEKKDQIATLYNPFLQIDLPQFSNFNSRLGKYFSAVEEKAAKKILAQCAELPRDFDELLAVAGQILGDDKEKLHRLLHRLCDEGYLVEKDEAFSFISAILADYWQKHYYFEK